jgi:hypothetical protein
MSADFRGVLVRAFELVEAQVRHSESGGTGDPWVLVQAEAAREVEDREVFTGALSSVGAVLAHIASEEAGTPIENILAAARQMMIGSPTNPAAD